MNPSFSLGLPGLPPLSFGAPATMAQDCGGASGGASGAGDWTVNLAGSGTALQTSTSGINWLLIAAGVLAWLVLKK